MPFPPVCPEVPVSDMAAALDYYRDRLGFIVDWSAEDIGLACVSRGDSRIFLTIAEYRAPFGTGGPIMLWLNLDGRAEVDALHAEWAKAGAQIDRPPGAQEYKLYEFLARDPDGNRFRIFYDFGWEEREGS